MNQRDIDAIVAGHVCLDIIPRFPGRKMSLEEAFRPGRLINIEEPSISTGGAVSNTGIPLSRLGARTTLMARIGADDFGRLTRERLAAAASTEGIVESSESASSYTLVISPPGVDRIFFHSPGANDAFGAEDVSEELCSYARVFHFGYPPLMKRMYENGGDELVAVFKKAWEAGATTSLDMALPDPASEAGRLDWRPILEKLLPYVDIFHPSVEEGLYMATPDLFRQAREKAGAGDMIDVLDGPEHGALAEQCIEWGAAVVTLKSGHRGFYIRTADAKRMHKLEAGKPQDLENWTGRELWRPAFKAPEGGSATGAGDCSLAGFLAAFLKGESVESTIACAVSAAWQNLHVLDAISGIRDWEATKQIAEDDSLEQLSFDLPTEGWAFDKKRRHWVGPNDSLGLT